MTAAVALRDTATLVDGLAREYFVRFMRRAQKAALIEWRDRTATPGVAARMEVSAYADYGFSHRPIGYDRAKGNARPYYHGGDFLAQLTARRPRTATATPATISTRLAYGGGVLNLMGAKYGILSYETAERIVRVSVKPYRWTNRKGTVVSVTGYVTTRHLHVRKRAIHSAVSYQEEWGQRFNTVDKPWIERRVGELFLDIYRRTALGRDGTLKNTYRQDMDAE